MKSSKSSVVAAMIVLGACAIVPLISGCHSDNNTSKPSADAVKQFTGDPSSHMPKNQGPPPSVGAPAAAPAPVAPTAPAAGN